MGKRDLIATMIVGLVLLWARPAPGQMYYQIDETGLPHFTNSPTTPKYRLLRPGASSGALGAGKLAELIEAYAAEHGLESALVRAVIQVESNFNHRAISRKGAQGLMQLMPATIWRLSVGNAYDPHENVGAGVRYLRELLDLFQGDLTLALAAYNAGEKAVLKYKGVPPYQETRDYVTKVLSLYRRIRGGRSGNGLVEVAQAAAPPPVPPPPTIYRAQETSGTILYSNIPPIVRSP